MKTIKQLREEKGLSPVEFAADLGVSLATIYNWETGKSEPRASMLRDIAEVLEVRMDDIWFPARSERQQRQQGRSHAAAV